MATSLPGAGCQRLRRGSPTPTLSTGRRQHSQKIPPTRRLALSTTTTTSSQQQEEVTIESEALGVTLEPIHEDFGMDVTGIHLKGGVSDDEIEFIKAALDQHHLLRFRNQEELDVEDEKQFMFQLPHRAEEELKGYVQNFHRDIPPAYPWMAVVASNLTFEDYHGLDIDKDNPSPFFKSRKVWHTDFYPPTSPPEYTCMSMKISPASGAGTEFFSAVKAYSSLTDEQKNIADGLRAINLTADSSMKVYKGIPNMEDVWGEDGFGLCNYDEIRKVVDIDSEDSGQAEAWPLVVRDPRTGEKSIMINFYRFLKFQGMSPEESRKLVTAFLGPATERAWIADWKANDIVVWKNRQLMHIVPPWSNWEGQSRLFHISMWGASNPLTF